MAARLGGGGEKAEDVDVELDSVLRIRYTETTEDRGWAERKWRWARVNDARGMYEEIRFCRCRFVCRFR